ncbi:MAG: FAD-binding domain-containing protein [Microcystaceae cyanobacterium]
MNPLILFWHRRDLRLSDNIGLSKAREKSAKVLGLFCLDPKILKADDIAPARVVYLLGCLAELQENYRQLGGDLLIFSGSPQEIIPNLAINLKVDTVFWNLDCEPYAQKRDQEVASILREQGLKVETYWDQLLHYPGEILSQSQQPYTVYTPFWKNWIQQPKINVAEAIASLIDLTDAEKSLTQQLGSIPLPTAQELGFNWTNTLPLLPGEKAAQEQLDWFVDHALSNYQEQRNFPAVLGTSQLSAALKFGAIGIRTIWQTVIEILENSRSEEVQANIKTWQQELAWREFYQHCLYFFPALAQGAYRETFKNFPWENNMDYFEAWCQGKTGYPMVDAAMRQLNETAWMHNRCRMIVANFLTKDLIINWQWGEKYFMQTLYDGDLAANNGGWQWSASSGMDPRPLRIFNPMTQAQNFDPEGEYIRQWLPELRSLDTVQLLTGKISELERAMLGYPNPIVDHHQQQQKFKQIYQIFKV